MRLTETTRGILNARRMARRMERDGYQRIEGPWQIIRGGRYQERIVDAVVDATGKSVWVKTALPSSTPSGE